LVVDIFRVVVEMIFFPAIPCARNELGLLTIAWVTCGMSPGGVRNADAIERFVSGNGTLLCGGAIVNGVMSTAEKAGALGTVVALPWATMEVP
jgi:hypothetical protein